MDEKIRQELIKLKKEVVCEKNYRCINSALENLCKAMYYAELKITVCLEKSTTSCINCKPFGIKNVCTCSLREFIAINQKKIYFYDANSNQNGN